MYLKEIELENFKSFGSKISIPFLPGFTAITGPNGSGKSNINDAILFILGVRSPKMVRAERLSDLIYKGERDAKYCKVSLVFDNSAGEIPIDSDEIVLTRKIKLAPLPTNPGNYYSYFYINGKAASLAEFVELLSAANISSSSIVQQGDVTAIVEMGDVQRRKIIDEIAGIAEFDKEIDKAKNEREEVEKNIEHIEIILGEIRRQIRQLKKERDEAAKFRELNEKLERTKAMISFKKKREIEREIAEVQRQIENYEQSKQHHEEEIQKLRELYKQKQIRFQEIDSKLAEMGGEELLEIKQHIDFFKEEAIKAKEKVNYYRKEMAEKKGEIQEQKAVLATITKELSEHLRTLEKKKGELKQTEKEIKRAEDELKKRKTEIEKKDELTVQIGRELALLKKNYEQKMQRLHELRLSHDRLVQQKEALAAQLSEAKELKQSFELELKEVKWEISELGKDKRDVVKKKEELERALFDRKKEEATTAETLRNLEKEMIRLQRELAQLRAKEDVTSLSQAAREVLRLRDEGTIRGIHGIVAELGKTDETYQRALEVAAGRRMEAVVVDNDGVAAQCIEYLKKHGCGRATFLPLNKLVAGKPRGKALLAARDKNAVGFAIDLISFDPKYREAFWYVFGDTVVVEHMDAARALMGGVRLVTLDGALIEASGAMTGGSLPKKSLFGAGDAKRIAEISATLREIHADQEALAKRLIEIKDEIGRIEDELHNLPSVDFEKIEQLEIRRREIEAKVKKVSGEVSEKEKKHDALEEELKGVEKRIKEEEEALKELEKTRSAKDEEMMRIVSKEVAKELESLKEQVEELTKTRIALEGEVQTLTKECEIIRERAEEIETKIAEAEGRVKELKKEMERESANHEKSKNELKTYEELERKLLSKTKGLSEERDELYREIVELENKLDTLSTKIETAIDLISRSKARLPTLESALAELIDVPHDFDEEKIPPIDELKRNMRQMEEQLQKIEPVNMRALEEYERQDERRAKFEEDLEKLREQRKNLIKLEREIEKKKKDTFYTVFDEISGNFREIYQELANGEGELILENPENPFEGGLLIKVRPSGKRMLHLNALSGGEKSIASLAFIFSLQAYEPSPFYVLDEVDMFLDEKNAERVAKIISQRAVTAQFIVVSLRRITLKHAHHIYGVTINNGISALIGNINLNEVEKIVEVK